MNNLIEITKRKVILGKTISFLKKMILFASSNNQVITMPSDNYIKLLQYNSNKTALLLIPIIVAKARHPV